MNERNNNNAERANKLRRENEELKEKLYVEGMRKEKEKRHLFIGAVAILGGIFALYFIVPYLLGLHQSGYSFLKRAIERKSLAKAWGTPAEPHILLDANVWEEEYIRQVEEMGFSIAEHTVERNLMVDKGEIFGKKYDEEINRYELADGKGEISVAKDIKGGDLISVCFYETGEDTDALILAALKEIGNQQGYAVEDGELEKWKEAREQVSLDPSMGRGVYRNIRVYFSYIEGYPKGTTYIIKGGADTSVMEPEG